MKAPLSWLREFVEIPASLSADEIAECFVKVGFEVEGIDLQGEGLRGPIVVGRVLSIEELTGHKKKIRFVGVDCGESETRFIVCGAKNFSVGDLVVVAKPGALLPGDFAISSRETYGKTSDGMICSAKELGMNDDHSGILVIEFEGVEPGDDAIEPLQVHDAIFDIAVNPDRGYALSIRGLARELAGALNRPFKDPAATVSRKSMGGINMPDLDRAGPVPVSISEGATEIYLRSVTNVSMSVKTPLWMRRRLEKCGMRSISLPVDITNYLMLEFGQPLHAFDSDQITGGIVVRSAGSNEFLTTLDDQKRILTAGDLLIADERSPLALAGTMGGASAEVSDETTRITIEAAHFIPESVARNSRGHRLSTEASRRFERFVDPMLPSFVSMRAVELLVEFGGAEVLGSSHAGALTTLKEISIDVSRLNQVLGRQYSGAEMESMLDRIGARYTVDSDRYRVEVPSWRPDLQTHSDFAEEIARIHGYDLIPHHLPTAPEGSIKRGGDSNQRKRRRLIVDFLAANGLSETQNYPFTSQEFIDALGFEGVRARSYKLANPLSDEYPVLRTHILQSLLPTAVRNFNRGTGDVAIFEIGRIFRAPERIASTKILPTGQRPKEQEITELLDSVPDQPTMVAGVMAGKVEKSGWWGQSRNVQWDDAIAYASEIVKILGGEAVITASDFAPWHPGRCAAITVDGIAVAHAGELHPRVVEKLGLPTRAVAFAVLVDAIPISPLVEPQKLATMPPAIQDVALLVDIDVASARVMSALKAGAGEVLERIELFDRYEGVVDGKVSLAFTLTLRASDRTLTAEEIAEIRNRAIERASSETGAVLRS